jgi:hypothetical protein
MFSAKKNCIFPFFYKQMIACLSVLTSITIFTCSPSTTIREQQMSQPCVIATCKRPSRVVCDCCEQRFCLPHLTQHNESLVSQLNPLTDEINALGSRLTAFNVIEITGNCRQKVEKCKN